MQIPVSGGHIEVQRRGGGGPAVVFLHYWGGSATTWEHVVDHLPRDRTTVRFDQRGWGSSRALPGPYGLHQLALDALRIVDGLDLGDFILVGHSMGGKVAQLVAAQRPASLTGMVLVAPAPPRPLDTITEQDQSFTAHVYDSADSVLRALDTRLAATPISQPDRDMVVRDSLAGNEGAREAWAWSGLVEDITAEVSAADVPTLVIVGDRDQVEPAQVQRANLLPFLKGARLESVPDAGHLLPLEAPKAIADAVERVLAGSGPAR